MTEELNQDPCEACTEETATTITSNGDALHQICPRCGEFKLSGTASSMLRSGTGKEKRAKLSGWIRDQNRSGVVPLVTSENLRTILDRPLPSVAERAERLLLEAQRGLDHLGEYFNVNEPRFLAATYSSSPADVSFLLQALQTQGLAQPVTLGGNSEILPAGYMHLDQIGRPFTDSAQGFVAMAFDSDLDQVYSDGFEKALLDAGYDPVRMDRVEHINRIDDEIIRQINASRFLVADFTGHRGGVYFEAGYALGLGLPIFWTCRKSEMGDLHFDIRQFNCIAWESPDDLAKRLSARVEAVLGRGRRAP